MKIVKKLKKKHRNDMWLDSDGFLWFWHADNECWNYLDGYMPFAGQPKGFFPEVAVSVKGWPDAPFTRVR